MKAAARKLCPAGEDTAPFIKHACRLCVLITHPPPSAPRCGATHPVQVYEVRQYPKSPRYKDLLPIVGPQSMLLTEGHVWKSQREAFNPGAYARVCVMLGREGLHGVCHHLHNDCGNTFRCMWCIQDSLVAPHAPECTQH